MNYEDEKQARTERRGRQILIGERKNRVLGGNTPVRSKNFRKANKGLSQEVMHVPTKGRRNVGVLRARVAEQHARIDLVDCMTFGLI